MDERVGRMIRGIRSFEDLWTFEANARQRNAFDEDVQQAIKERSTELGRALIAERSGLNVTNLSPAEEKIVKAVVGYVGMMKRDGKDATRTFMQLRNRGLLGAAEVAVAKSKPTQGYQALVDADLSDLSYEQIIIDHPEEFSSRALWFARRTLGLPNNISKAPARSMTPVQRRTEQLLSWLQERADANGGRLPPHTSAEAASALGLGEMHEIGRVFGNIQSRIDHACYLAGLPPLGLTATKPFALAWNRDARSWAFPVAAMQNAAQAKIWTAADFDAIRRGTEGLPGQAHLAWQPELSAHEDRVRDWAFGLSAPTIASGEPAAVRSRNPDWSRNELILALDLYLRFRTSPPGKASAEVTRLSALLRQMAERAGVPISATYRNANGVYMKMMNFRSIDPEYTAEGRVGLQANNDLERTVWEQFAEDPDRRQEAVELIKAGLSADGPTVSSDGTYWVFACNPKKWAIDRFLAQRIERDTWGVRPSDKDKFAPGQLGIIRVGVDQRNAAERDGRPPLASGIYALCEVESTAFPAKGANGAFWSSGAGREAGWPTVDIRYLRSYLSNPLLIDRLRQDHPGLSELLLKGFQAASFSITPDDFHTVMRALGEDLDALPRGDEKAEAADQLGPLESRYMDASPEVKTRVSRYIERGPVASAVKRANSFKCQVCEQLGDNPIGFLKPNGDPYVEAHHVMPVHKGEVGSLAASNIMTVCPNHHRQLHYGGVNVVITGTAFELRVLGQPLSIPRTAVDVTSPVAKPIYDLHAES